MATLEKDLNNVSLSEETVFASDDAASSSNLHPAQFPSENCVICLDQLLQSGATALPCKHEHFHFLCLATWLQQSQICPLCKCEVVAARYEDETTGLKHIFNVGGKDTGRDLFVRKEGNTRTSTRRGRRRFHGRPSSIGANTDRAIQFRRYVYERNLYSLYVGSNATNRYRNLTPCLLSRDERLLAKAKRWIRRELRVFDHLNPDGCHPHSRADRRANNAEFLLNYILAIVKAIDLRGSAGQAQELIQEFLGRDATRLFLHELEAFLRSPSEDLNDWDKSVQYTEG